MANVWDDITSPADSALANTLGAIIRQLKIDLPLWTGAAAPVRAILHEFGGLAAWVGAPTAAYLAGTSFATLAPNTDIVDFDSVILPAGTYKLETCLASEGGATVTLGLMNLTDGAPDTPLVEITSVSATGEQKQSGAIAFAAAGSSKKYGVKLKTSDITKQYAAWGIRLRRTA